MKGADQCPKCASRRTTDVAQEVTDFYAGILRVCANCGTAWEPFDPAELIDPKHEPLGAFNHPCGNCAFRKGSPEQADAIGWGETMAKLEAGSSFYCHKGVPVTPGDEHGFAYPEGGRNPRKLRLCRGYLNAIVGRRIARFAAEADSGAEEEWTDVV
jgi:hypothetical protein